MKCVNCKENEAVFSADCLLVKHESHQMYRTSSGTRYEVREAICGGTQAGLCEKCLNKAIQQSGEALVIGDKGFLPLMLIVGGILLIGLGLYCSFAQESLAPYRWLTAAVCAVPVLIGAAILIRQKKVAKQTLLNQPWKVMGRRGLGEKTPDDGNRYVPVGDGFYRGYDDFSTVNWCLLDETRRKVFDELIETGEWKHALERGAVDPGSLFAPDAALNNLIDRMRKGAN